MKKYTLKKDHHHVPGFGLVTREEFNDEHLNAMVQFVISHGGDPSTCLATHLIEVENNNQILIPTPTVDINSIVKEKKTVDLGKVDKRSKEYKESQKAIEQEKVA